MSSTRSRLPWSTTNLNSPLRTAILVCLVALLCYLAAKVGDAMVLRPQMVWPLWPGCALLVAVLLLAPRKIWPLLIAAGLVGFVLYNLPAGLPLRSTAWLILADTIEILIAALGVSYAFAGVPRLNTVTSLAKYSAFAVILAPISTAFIGAGALSGDYWLRWKTSFFTEALALLTLTPAILSWASVGRVWARKSRAFYLEAAAMTAGLVVFSFIAFVVPGRGSSPVLLYSLLPFLLWSALRFGLTGITTSMIVVAFLSIWGAVHGRGPFTGSEPLNNVISLQLFLLFAATPFMVLAVLVEERKQAEQSLRESEKRFRLLADTAPALIWMSGADKLCTYFNKPWLDFTGRSMDSELGNGWAEDVHPEDLQRRLETYNKSFDGREQLRMEYRLRRHDGEYRWVLDIGIPRFDQDGSFVGYIGSGVDVTERKRAEEALRQRDVQLTEAQRLAGVGSWQWDAQNDKVVWSKELYRLVGLDPDLPAPSFKEQPSLFTAESWERLQAAAKEALQTGTPYELDMEILNPEPATKWAIARGEPLRDSGGQIIGLRGTVQDITERKQAEQAQRESESRERARVKELEAILDAVPVPVLIAHDVECRHITGNRAASEQLREARGQNLSQSAPPGQRPAFRQIKNGVEIPADLLPMQQAAATGKPMYGRELTLLYQDGTTREEIANAVPLLDESGRPRGAVGASMDVTELKRTEGALRESEDKLRLLLDSTAEAIYGVDLEHRCTFCNPACLRTLGYEHADQVIGKNMHSLIHHSRADGTAYPVEECRVHRVTQTGQGLHAEDEVLWRANGTSFPAEYWSYPQRKREEVVGAVVAFIDITERKLAEAALANVSRKLIEAQEQERTRIGRELHDDIGQRLAIVAIELQQLHDDPLVLPEVRSRTGELQKQISGIADDIQSLSHELHSAKLQYLGIARAIRGFCREFGEQQKVEVNFQTHDLPSPLSPDISLCFFRVLQEALHNAVKHSRIRHFEVRLWGTSEEIHLTIKDSGIGFDRDAARASRGLGLISMEERLKLVNGTLSIDSQPKRGTTIHARVPLASVAGSMSAAG
jgi:PAS domain S-box-containing protein